MGFHTLEFYADTINGKIQEAPVFMYLRCDRIRPLGRDIVRMFDGNECIEAISVFLIEVSGMVLGSTEFKSFDDFINYRNASCSGVSSICGLYLNGCLVTLNGCAATMT